jgi:hypothetical protein
MCLLMVVDVATRGSISLNYKLCVRAYCIFFTRSPYPGMHVPARLCGAPTCKDGGAPYSAIAGIRTFLPSDSTYEIPTPQ